MSAPISNGFCSSGVANTLSTTTSAPAWCANAATARRSTTSSIGFEGVSSSTIVAGVDNARRQPSMSAPSTNSLAMP